MEVRFKLSSNFKGVNMSKFSNFIKIIIKSPVDKKLHFAYSALIAIQVS